MRLKYTMEKKSKANELILREYTEIDEERYVLLNETIYNSEKIVSAVSKSERELLIALRTENMFPPDMFANRLFEMVTTLLNSKKRQCIEIVVDDLDYIDKKHKKIKMDRLSMPSHVYSPDEITVPGFLPDLPDIRMLFHRSDSAPYGK